jgi:hypothetical protein
MKSPRFATVVCAAWVSVMMAWSAEPGLPADAPNYTGKYSLQERKNAPVSSDPEVEVVQTESDVQVTTTSGGNRTTNRYPLNNSEGDYVSPGGVPGKCKARFKGSQLILESMVVTHPQPNVPVRMHIKERWELSKDSKTLTIQTDIDFPDMSAAISSAVTENSPEKQKYVRIDSR